MANGVGDEFVGDVEPPVVGRVRVEVSVERFGRVGIGCAKAEHDATKCLAGADVGVGRGTVADPFATDAGLLVGELERGVRDGSQGVHVIQRGVCGVVDAAVDGERHVFVAEGLRAAPRGHPVRLVGVLGRPQEPEESDEDEIGGVGVESALFRVLEVEAVRECSQHGDVGWVHAGLGVVFVGERLEEISE